MANLVTLNKVSVIFQARGHFFLRSVPVRALDEVSLTINEQETVGVVGESGSGKTTLGRVSLGLIKPTIGTVYFRGKDITNAKETYLRSEIRRDAQAIFQDPFSSLDPYMTVGQIVQEPLIIYGLGSKAQQRERVLKVLEEVRLIPPEEFAAKFPHMLSGGERQRVAIARALILEPIYIVADEPVSMIDASSRAEILNVLTTLQEKHGIAFLYITHDLATARHFCHRLVILYLGSIVETAPTNILLEKPLHPYTVALIQAVPEPDPSNRFRIRQVVSGEPPDPTNIPPGCPFQTRCPQVISVCRNQKPNLRQVSNGHLVACHLFS